MPHNLTLTIRSVVDNPMPFYQGNGVRSVIDCPAFEPGQTWELFWATVGVENDPLEDSDIFLRKFVDERLDRVAACTNAMSGVKNPPLMMATARAIADLCESVDARAQATDGPVPTTLEAIDRQERKTLEELLSQLYHLIKAPT